MNHPIPDSETVGETFQMLLGRDVGVSDAKPSSDGKQVVASFVHADGSAAAACTCEVALAAATGCALSMIPAGTAKDAAKEGALSGSMKSNFYEVMNIFSRLLMNDHSPHLKLAGLFDSIADSPADIADLIANAPERRGYKVSVGGGYGEGVVSVFTS